MRPAHVFASMSAEQHTELITALHGPWRNATRIMMVVLSAAGWTALLDAHRPAPPDPDPGTNLRRTMHGAINLTTGAVHHHVSVKNVSAVFCYFLQQLLDAYPNAPAIAVICDNGSTHHSNITKRWLAEHPRIQVIEGAKYSPQDKPVERIWAAMKQAIANTASATVTNRVYQAHAFFQHRTDTQHLATAAAVSAARQGRYSPGCQGALNTCSRGRFCESTKCFGDCGSRDARGGGGPSGDGRRGGDRQ